MKTKLTNKHQQGWTPFFIVWLIIAVALIPVFAFGVYKLGNLVHSLLWTKEKPEPAVPAPIKPAAFQPAAINIHPEPFCVDEAGS